MRLSEERIDFISDQILDALFKDDLIKIDGSEKTIRHEMNRVMMTDLAMEDKIDEVVVNMIRSLKRNVPEGSPEWNAIFLQKKEEIASKYNYTL